MSEVFCERSWDTPMPEAQVRSTFDGARCCLALHRCVWRGSFLSADGRALFCRFTCPDAESLRIALQPVGSPGVRIWAGTVHDAPGTGEPDEANVLVSRRFEQPTSLDSMIALAQRAEACMALHGVRVLGSWVSNDQRRMLCLYRAPDAESVRVAQYRAAMPVERVMAVHALRP